MTDEVSQNQPPAAEQLVSPTGISQQAQTTVSNPTDKKGSAFKKVALIFLITIGLLIFLVIALVLFSSRVLHKTPYIVMLPKTIPLGFIRENTIISERDEAGRFYIFTYTNSNNESFIYHLRYNSDNYEKCSPPEEPSSFLSDYKKFNPKDSLDGCAMTLTDKNGFKKRAYRWQVDGAQFFIFAENLSLTDQEAFEVGSSLKPKLVFIGEHVD